MQVSPLSAWWKVSILVSGVIVLGLTWLAMIFALIWRDYPPLKSKQLDILCVALIASTCWWIGIVFSFGTFEGIPFFSSCVFWDVWMQSVFGAQLYISTFSMRMLRLYYVLIRHKTPSEQPLRFYGTLGLFYLPSCILAILPIIWPGKLITVEPVLVPLVYACDFNIGYVAAFEVWLLIHISYLLYLNWKLSQIRKAFNEFRELQIALYAFIFLIFLEVVGYVLNFKDTTHGKIILSLMEAVTAVWLVLVPILPPIYGFIFDKEGYYETWRQGLLDEDLPKALKYDESSNAAVHTPIWTQSNGYTPNTPT
ncbi:hypothetical protein EDD86DRAFT_87423 [Gorgonomyces haynaldii]|nr:hypothetical protein EDD86DRAFT_87423 [Gorgonomyces haynaldii]